MWELAGNKPRRYTHNLDLPLPLKLNILSILSPLSHVLTCLVNKIRNSLVANRSVFKLFSTE